MSQSKRAFQFEGNDNDYIAFLESRLSAALIQGTSLAFIDSATSLRNAPATTSSNSQPSTSTTALADSHHGNLAIAPTSSTESQPRDYRNGCSVFQASCPTSPRSAGCSPLPTRDDLKILYYDPFQNRDSDLPGNTLSKLSSFKQTSGVEAQGKKELRRFIEEVTRNDHWIKKKKDLGLSRPEINQDTIHALCGRPLASNLRNESNLYPNEDSLEHSALIMRGCDYGALTKDRKLQGNLLLHIAKYQQLIFVSLCVVMLEIGTPIDSVDWMMRRYISDTSSANLRRLRYGCKWVNRCMSKLLERNWGFSSWEAFVLFPRSIQQYGRFAYTKNSYETFVTGMGTPDLALPFAEDGLSPYCLPCFIKVIAGNDLKLVDICNILGYSILLVSPIYEAYFNNAPLDFNPFTHAYSEPVVDFNPFTYAQNDPVVVFDTLDKAFSGGANDS